MGIFKLSPAFSKFFSEFDHQTLCPPIMTGFFALHANSSISQRVIGSGHALATGFALCENGLSSSPTFSSYEENIISTGKLR